uniref:Uncharacterized protein n=1 Tax=Plectus sambesii TaxID=2011161 RepID=A0A914UJL7_9BILA
MYAVLLIAFVACASANPLPADTVDEGTKTCMTTLQTKLQGDADFKTKVQMLGYDGKFVAIKDEVLKKIQELCPDQFEKINSFVQQHSSGLDVLERLYANMSDEEKEQVKKGHETKDFSSVIKLFAKKFQTLSPEDQQSLKDTFESMLKPFMHTKPAIVDKFLNSLTPAEKEEVTQYFKNHEFEKLTNFVKAKLETNAAGFTEDEKAQMNGFLGMMNGKQQTTA